MNMRFSKEEIYNIIIAWLVLTILLSRFKLYLLPISLIAVGTAFVCHELGHKYVAQKYNLFAEFRIWKEGLLMAMIIAIVSRGNFIFAAPGAVYIFGYMISEEQNGKISFAGPATNLTISSLSILMYSIFPNLLFSYVAMINGYLGLFNLLPVPPLDGSKIIRWKRNIYIITVGIAFVLIFLIEYFII